MSKNSVETIKQEQKYKILIRNLRKQQEEKNNEKTNDKKADSNQSKCLWNARTTDSLRGQEN